MQKRGEEKRRFGCLQHFVFKDNWFISNIIMLFTFQREYFGISFYIHFKLEYVYKFLYHEFFVYSSILIYTNSLRLILLGKSIDSKLLI